MSSDTPGAEEGPLLPIDPRWLYAGFYALIGLWIVYLLATMGGWRWEDQVVPLLIGIPGILLVLIYLFRVRYPDVFARLNPVVRPVDEEEEGHLDHLMDEVEEATETEAARTPKERQWIELVMMGWVIALPIVMQYLGFFIALPLYVFAFGIYFTGDTKRSLVISVLFTLFVYVFFVTILGARVYAGDFGIQPALPRFQFF